MTGWSQADYVRPQEALVILAAYWTIYAFVERVGTVAADGAVNVVDSPTVLVEFKGPSVVYNSARRDQSPD